MNVYTHNDTHTYVNGSLEFLIDVKSPWKVRMYTEYKDGPFNWNVRAFDRKYPDFCAAMKDSAEPSYEITKNLKGCPLSKGVS